MISGRVTVRRCWGWEYLDHAESSGTVHITARDRDGRPRLIRADRFVKAVGFDIEGNDPLPTSSSRVRSVSPRHLDPRFDGTNVDAVREWFIREYTTSALDNPVLVLRSGARREIAPQSWIVNCTGHFQPRERPRSPMLPRAARSCRSTPHR